MHLDLFIFEILLNWINLFWYYLSLCRASVFGRTDLGLSCAGNVQTIFWITVDLCKVRRLITPYFPSSHPFPSFPTSIPTWIFFSFPLSSFLLLPSPSSLLFRPCSPLKWRILTLIHADTSMRGGDYTKQGSTLRETTSSTLPSKQGRELDLKFLSASRIPPRASTFHHLIHLYSYYEILSNIREDWEFSLSPGGIATNGYHGTYELYCNRIYLYLYLFAYSLSSFVRL